MNAHSHQPLDCCAEYEDAAKLSRRRFLKGMAATSAAAVSTTMFGDALRQTSFGATTGGNVMVVISLRGGIDGLGMVVPHGDPAYYTARPSIGIPRESLVGQDAMFGLHPKMKPLEWLFTSGELAAVHAVGLPVPNRSHFAAMEEIEDADPTSSERRGWINRMIGLNATQDPIEGIALGSSVIPTSLSGIDPVLGTTELDQLSLVGADTDPAWAARRRDQLAQIWAGGAGLPLFDGYRSAMRTADKLAPVVASSYTPAVTYPRPALAADLSDALKDTARLIKANIGTDAVSIDFGTWDMHSDYGNVTTGDMQAMTGGFAAVLDAFMRDLGPDLRQRVTVVTISEFGRRIKENGNKGLDHGWGNMMLVAGGGVKGGKYYGQWPGLGDGKQVDDDLKVTTDYRNVLGEIVTSRFPDRSVSGVFPGLTYSPLGLMS
jgi:uncharacterized protein (DUF1501 family)